MNSNAGWFVGEEPVAQELVETQCFGCLSSHRKLSNLGDNLLVFSQLLSNQYTTLDQKVLLCWECGAQLKKARLFKEKVENAQQQLRFWSKNPKECLSTLIISTEVWTMGQVPHETLKSPADLKTYDDKHLVNIPKSYPETWVEDGISIEQENPNNNANKKTKTRKCKKNISPLSLPLSLRKLRKSKQVPVEESIINYEEIKNEVLDDDESFDNYDEADYNEDEQDIKDEQQETENELKLELKVEPNTELAQNSDKNINPMAEDNYSDAGDTRENDFEWPLEEEDKTINTQIDKKDLQCKEKPKKKRDLQKELKDDSDFELPLDKIKNKKLKKYKLLKDPDFELSDSIKRRLGMNIKTRKNKNKPNSTVTKEHENETADERGRTKMICDKDPTNLPYKKVVPINKVSVKRVTVSVEEMAVLLEQDRNNKFFSKLKNDVCKKCVKVITNAKTREHINDHKQTPDKTHLCSLCELPFSSEEAKVQHMTSSHTSAFECSKCGYKCTILEFMATHLWGHRQEFLQCLECGGQYKCQKEFYKHYCCCDICDRSYNNRNRLIKHMYNWHLPHNCTYCRRKLKNYKLYEKHVIKHHHEGLVEGAENAYCVMCDKTFLNRISYEKHVRTSSAHNVERGLQPSEKSKATDRFKCLDPECPNSYTDKGMMKRHYNRIHKQIFTYYDCKQCDKKYTSKPHLNYHVKRVHEGIRPEKDKFCNICGRGFSVKQTLVHHIRTHTGERPFKCEYCDSSFAQRTPMLYHVKHIHQNVKRKPYVPKRAGARASHNVSSGSQNPGYVLSGSEIDVSSGSGGHNVIVDNVPDYGASYSGYVSGFYG